MIHPPSLLVTMPQPFIFGQVRTRVREERTTQLATDTRFHIRSSQNLNTVDPSMIRSIYLSLTARIVPWVSLLPRYPSSSSPVSDIGRQDYSLSIQDNRILPRLISEINRGFLLQLLSLTWSTRTFLLSFLLDFKPSHEINAWGLTKNEN